VKLSIVIPVLNEASGIETLLSSLQPLRRRGHEVLVIDGGSSDATVASAAPRCDTCRVSGRGRAAQMRAGAALAGGDVLWFLHADSCIPAHADALILDALAGGAWGGFPVYLSGRKKLLRIVERMMNRRSRLTGILTGDQGIFVTRELFAQCGGFADIPLMEDIDLSTRLRRVMRPVFATGVLGTSSRRWDRDGVSKTIVRMWLLRLAFHVGVPAHYLAPYYV